jgi:hypothetical protein
MNVLLALWLVSCVNFPAVVQSSDIIFENASLASRGSILNDIQALNISCFPKDTCYDDKVSVR